MDSHRHFRHDPSPAPFTVASAKAISKKVFSAAVGRYGSISRDCIDRDDFKSISIILLVEGVPTVVLAGPGRLFGDCSIN